MKKTTLFIIAMLTTMLFSIRTFAQSQQYQNPAQNGIHVSGGYSDQTHASSNIGTDCEALGNHSFAAGFESIAHGHSSFAIGYKCQGIEPNTYAFGDCAYVKESNGMALGAYVKSLTSNCVVIGTGHNYLNPLSCSTPGVAMGVNSTIPTLFVSKANGNYRTGRVAIGNTTAPQTKFHIVADNEEEAGIYLQTLGKTRAFVRFLDEKHELAVDDDGSMHLMSINKPFHLESRNATLSDGVFSLGNPNDRKLTFMASGYPAIFSNAYRTGNNYFRYTNGSSFAIEFNDDAIRFRTAVYHDPRVTGIDNWRDPLLLKTNGNIVLNGKVGINRENTTSDYTLAVAGGVITTKVFIQDVEEWPDYVFEDTYRLMPLHELKKFIGDNKHLPDIPSEKEIVGQGYDMQEIQQAMLKKIEELTLYTMQQQEEIDALKKTINELKGK